MKLPKILALAVFATLSVAAPVYAAVQGSASLVVESADGNKTKVKAVVKDVVWGGEDGTPQPKAGTANITLKRGMIDAATLAHLQDDKVLIPSVTLELAGEAKPVPYLKYKLERCFVKSWSVSGDADVVEISYGTLKTDG